MKQTPPTKPSQTPGQRVRSFVKAYASAHYDGTSFSILKCTCGWPDDDGERTASGRFPHVWEVEVCWKTPRDTGYMTLFLKEEGTQFLVTATDGTTPKQIYTLVPSTNRGRYALDDPQEGHDLTCGESCFIWLSGQWVHGHVEHSGMPSTLRFPDAEGVYTLTNADGLRIGYYFIATGGGVCGLCAGMRVRY
jgi:hypothetical protein